jgi:hypothetical protein
MKKLITACLLLISTAAVVSCTDDDDTTETTPSIVGTWKNDLEDNDMDWYWHFQPDGTWVEIVVYGTSGKANVMKRAYFFENDKLYLNLREASYKFSNNKLAVERIDEDGYPYPTETFTRVPDDIIAPYLELLKNEENGVFISNLNVKEGGITDVYEVNVRTFRTDEIPATYPIRAEIPQKATGNVKVRFGIDNYLVKVYNETAHTSYLTVPSENVRLVNPEVTIAQGERVSDVASVEIFSVDGLQEGSTYLIPVTIESVSGGVTRINHHMKTVFLKVIM